MSTRKKAFIAVKILLTVGLLAYILIVRFDYGNFREALAGMHVNYLAIGVGIGLVFNLIKFIKWHYLLRVRGVPATFGDAFTSYAIGNGVGIATPGRAGELARALYFPKPQRGRVLGLVVYDRMLDVAVSMMLAIPGAFIVTGNGLFGAVVVLLALAMGVLAFRSRTLVACWRTARRLTGKREELAAPPGDLVNAKQAVVSLLLSLFAFGLVLVQMHFFIIGFQAVEPVAVVMAMPLVIISNLLPLTVFGLGVREGIAQQAFAPYGVGEEVAATCAFLIFVVNTLSFALVGVFLLSRLRLGRNGNGPSPEEDGPQA